MIYSPAEGKSRKHQSLWSHFQHLVTRSYRSRVSVHVKTSHKSISIVVGLSKQGRFKQILDPQDVVQPVVVLDEKMSGK